MGVTASKDSKSSTNDNPHARGPLVKRTAPVTAGDSGQEDLTDPARRAQGYEEGQEMDKNIGA